MSKIVKFTGKALYCKPYPDQIDREFSNPEEPRDRGGNWSTCLVVDDDTIKLFKATGTKAKVKRIEDFKKTPDGFSVEDKFLTFRRYEKLSNQTIISDGVLVYGVDPGTFIGNGSDVTLEVEVYSTAYNDKPIVGMRWVSVTVDKLVRYEKIKGVEEPDTTPPVH